MRDRRPAQVPHHPGVLRTGAVVLAVAFVVMTAWFWWFTTSPMHQSSSGPVAPTTPATPTQDASPSPSGPPPAPEVSDPTADGAALSEWSILSGVAGMEVTGKVTNTGSSVLSGTAVTYVYIDDKPIGTATARITNLQPGAATRVTMTADTQWQAGDKIIQFAFRPQ